MTRTQLPIPPRVASALISLCLPPGVVRETVLGDLREMYENRVGSPAGSPGSVPRQGAYPNTRESRGSASLWYWSQVPLVGGRYLLRRVLHRRLYISLASSSPDSPSLSSGGHMFDDFWSDVRFATRSLRRSPGFAIAAVLVIGIGIGAISLMFSTINTVLLQPLPFEEPDRLVWVWGSTERIPQNTISYPDYVDYRDGAPAFESLAASSLFQRTRVLTGSEGAERVVTYFVSANLFTTLGIPPEVGRAFLAEEEDAGTDGVVVLSQGFWQRRYAGDPAVVGSVIILDGLPAEVVGVMPAGFDYPAGTDVWFPIQRDANYTQSRGNNSFAVLGRLREGVPIRLAQSQMGLIARNIAESYPEEKADSWVTLVPLHERFFGPTRTTLLMLAGIISLVPLVACANAASLFMARAVTRRSELASRLALGASRARVVRQLLTEGLVVALAGGGVGLAIAFFGGEALLSFAPAALPRLSAIGIDGSVLTVTLAASFLMVPLFGLAPALRGTGMRIAETLKVGGERGASGRGSRFRNFLVVTQVALSVMLMAASGLFLRSFLNLQEVDPGFRTESVLSLNALLPAFKYRSPEEIEQAWNDVNRRLETVPGVRAVGFVDRRPFSGNGPLNGVWATERPPASIAEQVPAIRRFASAGYFDALGISLLAGRYFEETEKWTRSSGTGVTVINQTLAQQFFPGEDPLGKTLVLGSIGSSSLVDLEILGVVADVYEVGPGSDPSATFYLPAQWQYDMLDVVVSSVGDPLLMAEAVREAVREVDGDITLSSFQTLQSRLSNTLFQPRFRSAVVGIFALVTLILSSIGIYGVLAFFVRQRSHEISLRLALGAGRRGVFRLVLARGMALVTGGIMIGLAGALAGTRMIQSWLFGVGGADPLTFCGVSLLMVFVALLACLVPTFRALGLDPAEVMKAE